VRRVKDKSLYFASNSCRRECDVANHPIGGNTDNKTSVNETIDIAAGSRLSYTHQNLGMPSSEARDSDGARHADIKMQAYRLLEYSHLVTDNYNNRNAHLIQRWEKPQNDKSCVTGTLQKTVQPQPQLDAGGVNRCHLPVPARALPRRELIPIVTTCIPRRR